MSLLDDQTIIEQETESGIVFNSLMKKPHPEWAGISLNELMSIMNLGMINKPEEQLCVFRPDFVRLKQAIHTASLRHHEYDVNIQKIAQTIWNEYTLPYVDPETNCSGRRIVFVI